MYTARIETDAGKVFNFGYKYGTVFDIDPLNGIDVDVNTSQAVQQIGNKIEGESVSGILRDITGVFVRDENILAKNMIEVLPVFTHGKLFFNDDYYTDIVVKKTPFVVIGYGRKPVFTIQVFCPSPFWFSKYNKTYALNGFTPNFIMPVTFTAGTTFTLGVPITDGITTVVNNGNFKTKFSAVFSAPFSALTNYGILNVISGEYFNLNDTLAVGDTVEVYYDENGKLYVYKTSGGVRTNIFYKLDEGSELFEIEAGANYLKMTAETGDVDDLRVKITFAEPFMGVIGDAV